MSVSTIQTLRLLKSASEKMQPFMLYGQVYCIEYVRHCVCLMVFARMCIYYSYPESS